MRILIDECLDWRLARVLPDHTVTSVRKMGWAGIKNGKLLALAINNNFHIFLTGDRNMAFQQNVPSLSIAIILLEAGGTRLDQTLPLMPKVVAALPAVQPGTITRIGL